jgi:SAM-dependent methyltransferase
MSTLSATGSANVWGPRWGSRPRDWALSEDQQVPTYEEAIRRAGIAPGQRVLDIGCGTGVFLRAAADRGATVAGLDAAEGLLELARARVPEADLRQGEMEQLPFDDDAFDVVTGFNSFFFAADMVAALREAGRVARPEALVVIQVWGRPDECGLTAMKQAVAPHLPAPEAGAAPPPPLWKPGVLEEIARQAGLTPESAFDTSWAYEYDDDATLVRAMLGAAGMAERLITSQEEAGAAILEALARHRTPSGGYRLENEWRYLIARA